MLSLLEINYKGKIILLDKADESLLVGWRITLHKPSKNLKEYVRLEKGRRETRERIYLHRLILPGIKLIDHINQNPLDNRRVNLRAATKSQNLANSTRKRKNHLPRGVEVRKDKFRAAIIVNKTRIYLGTFTTAKEAGDAYRKAAKQYHGEYISDV
jgi:hypothetical protein